MATPAVTTAPFAALAALDALEASLDHQAWFATLGDPPTDAEAADARGHLDGLGLGAIGVEWITDLAAARDVARRPDWDHAWADAERAAVAALTAMVDVTVGRARATERLNRLMARASWLAIGPAAAAAARLGVADPGLNRAMAGAATQAAFERALAVVAGAPREHPLAAKYRLFAGGRWPLAVAGGCFFVL